MKRKKKKPRKKRRPYRPPEVVTEEIFERYALMCVKNPESRSYLS